MSESKIIVENGADTKDWPEPVKRAFLNLCWLADQYDFSVLCAVGLNRVQAAAGDIKLESFFSRKTLAACVKFSVLH